MRRAAHGYHPRSSERSERTLHHPPPAWLVGAVLYGLSWPATDAVNTSFLAWFAFVPLFVELERHDRFRPFALRVVSFMTVAGFVACWWWFFGVPPAVMPLTWTAGAQEILLESVPLLIVFFLRRRFSYGRSLLALVFVWPLWEWAYQTLPWVLGSFVVGNTQAASVALVQFADLFGVWGVTAWVVLCNVLIYLRLDAAHGRFDGAFWRRLAATMAVLVGLPWAYGAYRVAALDGQDETIHITLLHTNLPPSSGDAQIKQANLEHLLRLTSATARRAHEAPPDLYVWAEGLLEPPDAAKPPAFLYDSVRSWRAPLLAGMVAQPVRAPGDTIRTNRAVLLPAASHQPDYTYDKMRLVPFWEGLPYYTHLDHFPLVAAYHRREGLYTPGDSARLLPLTTRDGRTVRLGTPICHEQNIPAIWAEMASTGADVFVQLSFESWFGTRGFATLLANVARLRSIENRRSTARVANGGRTVFIDATGRTYGGTSGPEAAVTADVPIYRTSTLYTQHPNLFALICLAGLAAMLGPSFTLGRTAGRQSSGGASSTVTAVP